MSTQDRSLRLPQVLEIAGVRKSKLYQMIRTGQFPAPAKLGRASLWSEAKVLDWQRRLHTEEAAAELSDILG